AGFLKSIFPEGGELESLHPNGEMNRWLESARAGVTGRASASAPSDEDLEAVRPGVTGRAAAGAPSDQELETARRALDRVSRNEPVNPEEAFALEAIVLPQGRPVIDIVDGRYAAPGAPWKKLDQAEFRSVLEPAILSIGRIEIPDHPSFPYA